MKLGRLHKRVVASRAMVTLATTSLALVLFSATVYAAVIPSVFLDDVRDLPFTSERTHQEADASGNAAASSNGDFAGGEGGVDDALGGGLSDALSAVTASLLGSPSFGGLDALIVDDSGQEPGGSEGGSEAQTPTDQSPSQPGGAQVPTPQPEPTEPSGDAEAEAAIHAHLVQMYSSLPAYYNRVCEGFNNLYACINSGDPSITHAHCAPINASALLREADQQRINVFSGGPDIPEDSRWHDTATQIVGLYNHLVNSCSVMREIDGFTCKNVPAQLKRYLDADGKVSELAAFERAYPTVRL